MNTARSALTFDQKTLIHQVHPAKLATDVITSIASDVLLWQHHLVAGLVLRWLPAVAVSIFVVRFGDLDKLGATPAGRYIAANMPPQTTAIRLGGDTVMAVGAWRREPALLALGAGLVILGWSGGLFKTARVRRRLAGGRAKSSGQ